VKSGFVIATFLPAAKHGAIKSDAIARVLKRLDFVMDGFFGER
jgi:hypothetical protein